jgi:carboxylesterase
MIRNNEIYFAGGPSCVLLIHGLTGTPNELRSVAHGLNRAGHTVLCVQLAGHCGSADELVATSADDWMRSVEDGARRLLQRCQRIFVGGLSMGAVLALRYAIQFPERTRGLALYGTSRWSWSLTPTVSRATCCAG